MVESSSGAEIPSTPPAPRSLTLAGVTVGAEVTGSSELVRAITVGSAVGGFDSDTEGLDVGLGEFTTGKGLGRDDWTVRIRCKD
jgi:hypothetical protein